MSVRTFAIAAAVSCASTASFAGDPTPPAGPLTGTMKTLDEVEPRLPLNATTAPSFGISVFAISDSGSYYLTDNIVIPADRSVGIRILASNVTVDLNGFTVFGGHASASAGVTVSSPEDGVVVQNGNISDFIFPGAIGVDTTATGSSRVTDIVTTNVPTGFSVGNNSIIERCVADGCSDTGFFLGPNSTVRDSTAFLCDNAGFNFAPVGKAFNCTASECGQGFSFVGDFTMVDCNVDTTTTGNGVTTNVGGGTISRCTIRGIANWGIVAVNASLLVIEDTVLDSINGVGINISSDSEARIDGCTIRATAAQGIFTSAGQVHVSDCLIENTGGDGMFILRGTVTDCTVTNAGGDGIEAVADTRIEGCRIDAPAANGILVLDRCSVVGNTITRPPGGTPGLGYGINPSGAGNLIDSNHIALEFFDIFGGIVLGPGDKNTIVRNVMVNTGMAFTGSPTGSLLGPDDDLTSPWANFSR